MVAGTSGRAEADGRFRLVVTGDAILNRPLSKVADPGFQGVREVVASGDAAFINLEMVHPQLPLTPTSICQGHAGSAPPEMVGELLDLGFNLFSFAHNHTADFGGKGIRDTLDLFRGTGAAIAGAGDTLEAARRPRYLETVNGRVGLIATTVSNAWLTAAVDPTAYDVGQPGVNPLRIHTEYFLDDARFEAVEEALEALEIPGATALPADKTFQMAFPDRNLHFSVRPKGSLLLGSALIQRGDRPEVRQTAVQEDKEAIIRWIREARRNSDLVVVSIASHEGANGGWDNEDTPEFLIDAAHDFIDAGADVIAGHGPHRLRPIEIYNGRPIFYSLGSFSFVYETFDRYGKDVYAHFGMSSDSTPSELTGQRARRGVDPVFESVVAVCEFIDGALDSVTLHPIDMGADRSRTKRGYPVLPSISDGTAILNRLAASGERFGTSISVEESMAHVVGSVKI
jgi:poly-gamma-glutamate capsule biosynthesis protein CapA/YwtB (metallophosphatase superfamily)